MNGFGSRFVMTELTGVFCLALGLFALVKNSHKRQNRFFALYNILVGLRFILPGLNELLPHNIALVVYRVTQALVPIGSFFLLCFIQDISGVYSKLSSRLLRGFTLAVIILAAPLYLTPLMIRDFTSQTVDGLTQFSLTVGPLYRINFVILIFLVSTTVVTLVQRLRVSTGFQKNQLMFVALGLACGLLAAVAYVASIRVPVLIWVCFASQLALNFCFATSIFKYRLFEFNLWMRRLSIYSGVYMSLTALPLLLFFPLQSWLASLNEGVWPLLYGAAIVYGILFSLAPMAISFLRAKSEQARWLHLRSQLQFLRDASDKIAAEARLSHQEITRRVIGVLKEFYWNRMKTPLSFIMAIVSEEDGSAVFAVEPEVVTDPVVLKKFMASLKSLPKTLLESGFNSLDLVQLIDQATDPIEVDELRAVRQYMASNQIELCIPFIHDGRLSGAVLLGAKQKGIFMPEELTTLVTVGAQAGLAVRKSELLSSNLELEKLDEMKHELISNITHEFKSPVQVVDNAVQAILADLQRENIDREKLADYLMMIQNNNGRLGLFIRNLLDVAKIENATVNLRPAVVDIDQMIRETMDLFKPSLEKKNIRVSIESPGPLRARVDPEKIRQVVTNLVSNAIKFTDHGLIQIRLQPKGKTFMVAVHDSGRGIPPDHLPSVFEKFFQVPESQAMNPDGTGLGLAIAKGWVEAHAGRIWVESLGDGQGTTFSFEVPVHCVVNDWEEQESA